MNWIDLDEARARLRSEATLLAQNQLRLSALRDAVEPSLQETSDEDVHDFLDVPTEIRTVLANCAAEIESVIVGLRSAADYQAVPELEVEGGSLDLSSADPTMIAAIRAQVIRDWFTPWKDENSPGGVRIPPGSPEETELSVFKAGGRWLATWRKVDIPADRPEEERWERLRIEAVPGRPGDLSYQDF